MSIFHGHIHIGADETLRVHLPGLAGKDVDYTINIAEGTTNGTNGVAARAPVAAPTAATMTREQWHRFVDSLEGAIDDPTFVRPPQGEYEERESMD